MILYCVFFNPLEAFSLFLQITEHPELEGTHKASPALNLGVFSTTLYPTELISGSSRLEPAQHLPA